MYKYASIPENFNILFLNFQPKSFSRQLDVYVRTQEYQMHNVAPAQRTKANAIEFCYDFILFFIFFIHFSPAFHCYFFNHLNFFPCSLSPFIYLFYILFFNFFASISYLFMRLIHFFIYALIYYLLHPAEFSFIAFCFDFS